MLKRLRFMVILALAIGILTSCSNADIASQNVSKDADDFKIDRRIVFYNGITDTYMLTIEGRCSLGNSDDRNAQLSVICKVGEDKYKKHLLGISDNVTYFVEQLEYAEVSAYNYKVVFKPQAIIPDIDLKIK